jgi:recombination protein RecA
MATKSLPSSSKGSSTLSLALDAIRKNKAVDIGTIVDTGGVEDQKPYISTGSLVLDNLIGGQLTKKGMPICPGVPRGMITEVYGAEGSGKTTFGLQCAVSCQRSGGTIAYLDFENAIQLNYASALGLDIEDAATFALFSPHTFEEGVEIMGSLIDAKVDLIIVDSVSAMVPQRILEAEASAEPQIGLLARKLSGFFPKIIHKLRTNGVTLIFINQIRSRVKTSQYDPGPDEDTSGGKALKFYAALRLSLKRRQKEHAEVMNTMTGVKEKTNIANIVRVTCEKNKISSHQGHQQDVVIRFGEGFDNVRSIIDIAEQRKLIKKGGAWITAMMSDDTERKFNGKEVLRKFYLETPTELNYLVSRIGEFSQTVRKIDAADIDESSIIVEDVVDDLPPSVSTTDDEFASLDLNFEE